MEMNDAHEWCICELRIWNQMKNDPRSYDRNPWPRDTGATLYQLSCEATNVGSRSTQNWPAPNVCGFIAQLVERRTGIARSRVQTPLKSWIFFRLLYAIAKIAIITARIILHLIWVDGKLAICTIRADIEYAVAALTICKKACCSRWTLNEMKWIYAYAGQQYKAKLKLFFLFIFVLTNFNLAWKVALFVIALNGGEAACERFVVSTEARKSNVFRS